MLNLFFAVLQRDLAIAGRQRGLALHNVLFFLLIVSLFPLGTDTDQTLLSAAAPALIWMAVLLSILLSAQQLFRADADDGTLTQYLLSPEPLSIIALAKVLAYWLVSALPLIVVAPLFVLLLGVPAAAVLPMMAALALGTPTLALVAGIGIALTLSLSRPGLLVSLIVFPLYVPILIFGSGVMRAAALGLSYAAALSLLGALLLLSLSLAPAAIAAALRIGQGVDQGTP